MLIARVDTRAEDGAGAAATGPSAAAVRGSLAPGSGAIDTMGVAEADRVSAGAVVTIAPMVIAELAVAVVRAAVAADAPEAAAVALAVATKFRVWGLGFRIWSLGFGV